jgi:threonine dehydrogenase-like Zn-dependent dehydrogenase
MIMGAGSIGLLWLICLRARNPLCIDMVDLADDKLKYAQGLGANSVFNVKDAKGDFFGTVGRKYDVVVDCTGVPSVIQNGFSLLDRDGHIIFFGVAPTKAKIEISPYQIYESSHKITGVYPDMRSFGVIIDMMARGILDFKPLISHRFHLNDFSKGFEFFMNNPDKRRKVVIYND